MDWQTEQSLLCDCGHPIDETTVSDPSDDEEIQRKTLAYVATQVTCNACASRDRASAKATDGNKPIPPGTKWRISKRE